ncbi:MAG: hypothetical protein BWX84_02797 [Verrucomicrobia bacterium ADurb.Bin118]|nr:MAG: hypothetical protein BWX84_02797 [Verrucomicrobia bacterium ADurb.Bin118]
MIAALTGRNAKALLPGEPMFEPFRCTDLEAAILKQRHTAAFGGFDHVQHGCSVSRQRCG